MIDNWVVPMRGETAGEQQVVGKVWSVFAELWSRGESVSWSHVSP